MGGGVEQGVSTSLSHNISQLSSKKEQLLCASKLSSYFLHLIGRSTKAIPDSQSFLFTLVNPSGNEPVKMAPKPGASILCNGNLGPTLGTTQYYDLLVWSVSSTNDSVSSHLDLGHGFVCPDSINKNSYFTGRNPFEISELEVFQVNLQNYYSSLILLSLNSKNFCMPYNFNNIFQYILLLQKRNYSNRTDFANSVAIL